MTPYHLLASLAFLAIVIAGLVGLGRTLWNERRKIARALKGEGVR